MMVFRHITAIILLPVVATVGVPWALLRNAPAHPNLTGVFLGIPLLLSGLFLMATTIHFFVTLGKGTLAPWDPPRKLVVQGVYRHVRNPMISGVFCILFGEVLAFHSPSLAYWFCLFVALNFLYIPLLEEPRLEKRFRKAYQAYRRNVPR